MGRLAPTPTGDLHAGHAATFLTAYDRCRAAGGQLILRIEDLDTARCREEYARSQIEDLRWLGIHWHHGPVFQSTRRHLYLDAWKLLRDREAIYPCKRSRREVADRATRAPHGEEPLFPTAWREPPASAHDFPQPDSTNWRFRVPDGEVIKFRDQRCGEIHRIAGKDFGDFLVWNHHNVPSYELAVTVDDLEMGITEIVRGEDLLTSTARQILIARALGRTLPSTYHCPLIPGPDGRRLAKRDRATSLRAWRENGLTPADIPGLIRKSVSGGASPVERPTGGHGRTGSKDQHFC